MSISIKIGVEKEVQFVMANADLVPSLHQFRGSCQPMWLFLAEGEHKLILSRNLSDSGEVVGVMKGANVKKMKAMVKEECEKEKEVIAGNSRRNSMTIDQAVPGNAIFDFLD